MLRRGRVSRVFDVVSKRLNKCYRSEDPGQQQRQTEKHVMNLCAAVIPL